MNILDFFQVGEVLDQTQPQKMRKPTGSNLVYLNIQNQLVLLSKVSQKYGVTLTFKKKFHYDDPLFMHRMVDTFFRDFRKKFNFVLFPEFNSSAQLHYHGVIWGCYQLPFMVMVKRWRRKYGFVKVELSLRHYFCTTIDNCSVKKYMLRPKKDSRCWLHYISKDYSKNGLWSVVNY